MLNRHSKVVVYFPLETTVFKKACFGFFFPVKITKRFSCYNSGVLYNNNYQNNFNNNRTNSEHKYYVVFQNTVCIIM